MHPLDLVREIRRLRVRLDDAPGGLSEDQRQGLAALEDDCRDWARRVALVEREAFHTLLHELASAEEPSSPAVVALIDKVRRCLLSKNS